MKHIANKGFTVSDVIGTATVSFMSWDRLMKLITKDECSETEILVGFTIKDDGLELNFRNIPQSDSGNNEPQK